MIVAVDHLDVASSVDRRTQITIARKTFKRLAAKVPVIVSSGNHDLDRRDGTGEKHALIMTGLPSITDIVGHPCGPEKPRPVDGSLWD